jgi:hypothetical protein
MRTTSAANDVFPILITIITFGGKDIYDVSRCAVLSTPLLLPLSLSKHYLKHCSQTSLIYGIPLGRIIKFPAHAKTKRKTIVLYILIIQFLRRRQNIVYLFIFIIVYVTTISE